jgi:phospholipid/cholesterol/gamma-HCH transport system substrate-binding protein
MFGRPVTEEEIQQILRDRAERLDPANRPTHSEVDNTTREWDYDANDFVDNVQNGRSKFEGMTPHLTRTERPLFQRTLGIGLLLVCLFFLWLSGAFFSKTFTEFDEVKLVAKKSGLALNETGDVKLRGMIVGTIREIKAEDDKVVVTLGMDPELIERVPRNVRAEIVPKTLFGEKYISLVPTTSTTDHLRAGDVITDAVVPVEFEKFFNDVYPLLTALPPEKIAYTLSALADSLEGRGDSLGATLEETNAYLKKLNPDLQTGVDDIVKLGDVSREYAGQMDEFGELLRNSAEVSRTLADVEDDLADFFEETDSLAGTLTSFLEAVDDDLIATTANSVQPLTVSADYSTIFPCLFKGLDMYLRHDSDTVFKNGTLHITMFMVSPQATQYDIDTERPVIPKQTVFDATSLTDPNARGYTAEGYFKGVGTLCDELKQTVATGEPVNTHEDPLHTSPEWWKFWGIKNSHNGKLGPESAYNRTSVASNLAGVDSPAQRAALKDVTAAMAGVKAADVPDVASLLLSPVVRGAESLEFSETR